MKTKSGIAIVAVVILGGLFLLLHKPNLPHPPGTLILKEKFADVGYATPEAAFETMMWAQINGKYSELLDSFSPQIRAESGLAPDERKQFERDSKKNWLSFKGTQIVAKKIISDSKVELKVSMEGKEGHRTFSVSSTLKSDYGIQPLVKVGNEWKIAGGFSGYTTNWDKSGNVINFVQQ